MDKGYKILEIEQIVNSIGSYIKTTSGRYFLNNLRPFKLIDDANNELDKVREVYDLVNKYGEIPLVVSTIDYKEIFKSIDQGIILDELTLALIRDDIEASISLNKYFLKVKENLVCIKNIVNSLYPSLNVHDAINNILGIDNKIKDDASKELKNIRHNIFSINGDIHHKISQLLNQYKSSLAGDNYVLRDGSFALPVNTSLKTNVKGIVRDVSDSGLTTFIEPIEIVELENELHVYEVNERNEINRILRTITALINENKQILIKNNLIIGEFDFIISKIKYGKDIDGNVVKLNDKKCLKLLSARHPLLDKNKVIPNDFIIEKNKFMMLISGPNAGGKTVALKTVGIISYMAKMGLLVPVSPDSEIPFFNHIYLDIGDDQSLENNLSTFSAHISNISNFLKFLTSKDLVIIDELGSGTDPKEGESIAIATMKYLLKKQCLSLITSHYDLVKKFGLGNESIINASFVFNEKKIEPTYHIILGIGGKSYGFLIAKKYGLNDEIISESINLYNKHYLTKEELRIKNLEEREIKVKENNEFIKKEKEKLKNRESELNDLESSLKLKEEKLKENKLTDLDDYIDKKYDEIQGIYQEFLKNKNFKEAAENLEKLQYKENNEVVELGDYVLISSLNSYGTIMKISHNKIEIQLDSGSKLNTTLDKITKTNKPSSRRKEIRNIDNEIFNVKSVNSSLNLVGYHLDEGVEALSRYLDDATLRHLKEVRIIHGYGTGRLREAIHQYLKTSRYVESYHLGNDIEGGSGSTIVILK